MLGAEEVKTLKACINVDHIEEDRGGPPLVDAAWHAFLPSNLQGNWREWMGTAER